jgi:hypothetical protein
MKKSLIAFESIVIVCALLFMSCEQQSSTTKNPIIGNSSSVTLTPTSTPTATPTPAILSEEDLLQEKYSLYSTSFMPALLTSDDPSGDSIVLEKSDPQDMEKFITSINFYGTWYPSEENSSSESIVISEFKINDADYKLLCIISHSDKSFDIYYQLKDHQQIGGYQYTIYSIDEDLGVYGLTYLNKTYMNMTESQYSILQRNDQENDEFVSEEGDDSYEEGDGAFIYTPLEYDEVRGIATKDIENELQNELNMDLSEIAFGRFEYEDDYYEYDGNYTYYINLYVTYYYGFEILSDKTFRVECVYTDSNMCGVLTLRSINIK